MRRIGAVFWFFRTSKFEIESACAEMLGGDSLVSRPPSTLDSQAGPGGLEGSSLEGFSCARQDHQPCLHFQKVELFY